MTYVTVSGDMAPLPGGDVTDWLYVCDVSPPHSTESVDYAPQPAYPRPDPDPQYDPSNPRYAPAPGTEWTYSPEQLEADAMLASAEAAEAARAAPQPTVRYEAGPPRERHLTLTEHPAPAPCDCEWCQLARQ